MDRDGLCSSTWWRSCCCCRYEHAQDREREHYLSSRSMRMRGANGRGGEHEPTLKDLQAAGLQHTYDAVSVGQGGVAAHV